MKNFLLLVSFVLLTASAFAQTDNRLKDPVPPELQFIGYSFTRTTFSNITPTNDVLQGQVIGRLFGPNSTNTVDRTAIYMEQRFVPFFVYRPRILDGFATFRSLFKIDYTAGDQAYGVGNNRGGAINGGQVNLQTLMANVEIRPHDAHWNLVIGMQRIFDNPRDPNVNTLEMAQNTGEKLSFWGTQAVGIGYYHTITPTTLYRLGAYQLWENQISKDDDVMLFMADINQRLSKKWEIGGNLWYVYDVAHGGGGISVLGQGLTSSLAEYNGAVRLRLPGTSQLYNAHVFWAGTNFTYNRDYIHGRFSADGFAQFNFGSMDSVGTGVAHVADISAFAVNLRAQYKYGRTPKDAIVLETIFTTGDEDGVTDGKVNSVITGNIWGSPVGIYTNHKALILFPDAQVVSRYYSAVHDISNMGLGVTGAFLNVYRDFIPNKFYGKIGLATAISNYSLTGGGNYMGTEANIELKYNLKVFLTVGFNAGYVWLGDFYNAPKATVSGVKPINPWVSFLTLSWLMF